MLQRTRTILCLLLLFVLVGSSTTLAQNPPRSPTETTRLFYQMLREKKFREAFMLSIWGVAIEGLSAQELEDLRPDMERMALAVSEKMPKDIDVSGEQISGDVATVFVKVVGSDGKEKVEPATLIKINNAWIMGDKENLELVKKAGNKFFFEARINAHHDDVQDMMTRISLGQVLYSQNRNGQFGNMAELIAAGVVPKDIETTDSTGYRFQIIRSADAKSWYATAEPAQYGRTGRLSFYLDATGVRSGDNGGKPLIVKNN
jgi:Domain of unknown function (DUF4878)